MKIGQISHHKKYKEAHYKAVAKFRKEKSERWKEITRASWKKWYENNREKFNKWRNERYKIEMSARSAVARALRQGILKRGLCKKCKSKEVEAHHSDYLKPLSIVWLCKKCHTKITNKKRANQS